MSNKFLIITMFSCLTAMTSVAMEAPKTQALPAGDILEDDALWTITRIDGGLRIVVNRDSFVYSKKKLSKASRQLRNDALGLLTSSTSQASEFREYPMHYDELAEQNPLFLLHECDKPACFFTRQRDFTVCPRTKARESTMAISAELKAKQELRVCSYASGELFFDLELMQKLHDDGVHVKKFVAIDPIFRFLIELAPWSDEARSFTTSELLSHAYSSSTYSSLVASNLPQFIQRAFKLRSLDTGFPSVEVVRRVQQFLQALVFLNRDEDDKSIELCLFEDAKKFADQNEVEIDFVYAMDFNDRNNKSPTNDLFKIICQKTRFNGLLLFWGMGVDDKKLVPAFGKVPPKGPSNPHGEKMFREYNARN